jgi:hypothetical protein
VIGRFCLVVLVASITLMAFVWQYAVLGLCLSLAPSLAFAFVLKDDSSINRRFFYRAFKLSLLAFFVCLIIGLTTLAGTMHRFCVSSVSKHAASMTQQQFDSSVQNCENNLQMWTVLLGMVFLVTGTHWIVVLKQNYINRLPLSQAIVASQRNSLRASQGHHSDNEELINRFSL